jgi:hypothetical protein
MLSKKCQLAALKSSKDHDVKSAEGYLPSEANWSPQHMNQGTVCSKVLVPGDLTVFAT